MNMGPTRQRSLIPRKDQEPRTIKDPTQKSRNPRKSQEPRAKNKNPAQWPAFCYPICPWGIARRAPRGGSWPYPAPRLPLAATLGVPTRPKWPSKDLPHARRPKNANAPICHWRQFGFPTKPKMAKQGSFTAFAPTKHACMTFMQIKLQQPMHMQHVRGNSNVSTPQVCMLCQSWRTNPSMKGKHVCARVWVPAIAFGSCNDFWFRNHRPFENKTNSPA